MRIVLSLVVLSLLAVAAFGQKHAGIPMGSRSQGPAFNFPYNPSLPPIGPIPSLGLNPSAFPQRGISAGRPAFHRRYFRPGGFYPYAAPVFGGGYYCCNPSPTNVVIVQAPVSPPEPIVQQPPAEPAKPEVHEYNWPTTSESEMREAESPSFSVALKDGSVYSAKAIWIQNGMLYFLTPEGECRSVSVSSVDRSLTEKLNKERKLRFRLPL